MARIQAHSRCGSDSYVPSPHTPDRLCPPTLDGILWYGTLDHLASNSSVISSLHVALELVGLKGFPLSSTSSAEMDIVWLLSPLRPVRPLEKSPWKASAA
jgi:hypothetical protein